MTSAKFNASTALFLASLLAAGSMLVPQAAAQSASGTADNSTKSASSKGDVAKVADPADLIDPDTAATAVEVRETPHFKSIRIRPVDDSGNSRALVRAVLEDSSALDALHTAIRGNTELMSALSSRDKAVDDVVSVTTDRNDNAIVFTRH